MQGKGKSQIKKEICIFFMEIVVYLLKGAFCVCVHEQHDDAEKYICSLPPVTCWVTGLGLMSP
jgi:hypothetical protein